MKKSLCFILVIISILGVISISASADSDFHPFYGKVDSACYLSSTPETDSSDICYIGTNETVVVFGEVEDWYKIMYVDNGNENFGYLLKTKVKTMFAATTSSDLNVRSSTDTDSDNNIIGQFNDYQTIYCIGEIMDNGWYQVEGNDKNTHSLISGYSAGSYITIDGVYSYLGSSVFPENLNDSESEESVSENYAENTLNYRTDTTAIPLHTESDSSSVAVVPAILIMGVALVVAIIKTKNA